MRRFKLLLYFLLLIFVINGSLLAQNFRFVVFGDNRISSRKLKLPSVFYKLIKKVNSLEPEPELIFSTGDIINGYTQDTDLIKKQFEIFFRAVRKFKSPLYIAVGNHDIFGNPYAESLYKMFVKYPGNELYYSIIHKNSLFIILDTEEIGREGKITGEQLKWLRHQLKQKRKKVKHVFVFFHRPIFPVATHIGSSLDAFPKERDKLVKILKKYNVKYVFVGHEHLYARVEKEGIVQIITGGAGANIRTRPERGGYYHFVVVDVKNETVKIKPVKIGDTPFPFFYEKSNDGKTVIIYYYTYKKYSKFHNPRKIIFQYGVDEYKNLKTIALKPYTEDRWKAEIKVPDYAKEYLIGIFYDDRGNYDTNIGRKYKIWLK